MQKKRIWELDAFRGLCVLGMVVVHLLYDLMNTYPLPGLRRSEFFAFVMLWGGVLFCSFPASVSPWGITPFAEV